LVPESVAASLRDALRLKRAVETGTYLGEGARRLAGLFPIVVTIELSEELYALAAQALAAYPNVEVVLGDSRSELERIVDPAQPTLYFLDGHWSAGSTAGEDAECPVLEELDAIARGHADDCVVIDDARLFAAPPPPPHDPRHWPSLTQILDVFRATRSNHFVTVVEDQIMAVPFGAKDIVACYAARRRTA